MSSPRLLVFAKAPVPGEVKTRLIPALGPDGAAVLHSALVGRTLERTAPFETTLCCAPDGEHPFFRECAEAFGVALAPQRGEGLGERMHLALAEALAGGGPAVLIGCDCVGMEAAHVAQAFDLLARHDAVLGPVADGGYWLVGLRRPCLELFHGVAWSTAEVMEQSRRRLSEAGLSWGELAPLHDLDRPEDLVRLPAGLRDLPALFRALTQGAGEAPSRGG